MKTRIDVGQVIYIPFEVRKITITKNDVEYKLLSSDGNTTLYYYDKDLECCYVPKEEGLVRVPKDDQ